MQHAGPSILLTSVTDGVAFYAGSFSSVIALQSFCIFASAAIIMLFYGVCTIFSAVLTWDIKR